MELRASREFFVFISDGPRQRSLAEEAKKQARELARLETKRERANERTTTRSLLLLVVTLLPSPCIGSILGGLSCPVKPRIAPLFLRHVPVLSIIKFLLFICVCQVCCWPSHLLSYPIRSWNPSRRFPLSHSACFHSALFFLFFFNIYFFVIFSFSVFCILSVAEAREGISQVSTETSRIPPRTPFAAGGRDFAHRQTASRCTRNFFSHLFIYFNSLYSQL